MPKKDDALPEKNEGFTPVPLTVSRYNTATFCVAVKAESPPVTHKPLELL